MAWEGERKRKRERGGAWHGRVAGGCGNSAEERREVSRECGWGGSFLQNEEAHG
jgi:hypothetical protein